MKLKSVLVLLVIVCMNGESSTAKKEIIKNGLEEITVIIKARTLAKVIAHNKKVEVIGILFNDITYKIIKDEKSFKVLQKTIEKGKWVVVGGVVKTEVLEAATASLPCLLSDKEKKKFFKDENLTSSDFNKSRCQPIEDVINFNALEDTNGSEVDKLEKLDGTSFK